VQRAVRVGSSPQNSCIFLAPRLLSCLLAFSRSTTRCSPPHPITSTRGPKLSSRLNSPPFPSGPLLPSPDAPKSTEAPRLSSPRLPFTPADGHLSDTPDQDQSWLYCKEGKFASLTQTRRVAEPSGRLIATKRTVQYFRRCWSGFLAWTLDTSRVDRRQEWGRRPRKDNSSIS